MLTSRSLRGVDAVGAGASSRARLGPGAESFDGAFRLEPAAGVGKSSDEDEDEDDEDEEDDEDDEEDEEEEDEEELEESSLSSPLSLPPSPSESEPESLESDPLSEEELDDDDDDEEESLSSLLVSDLLSFSSLFFPAGAFTL